MKLKEMRMRKYFIEAAQKLMEEEEMPSITIKKIAEVAGYNSATIYNYFQNVDELFVYASINFLKPYILELKKRSEKTKNAVELYRLVYEVFNYYTFRRPEIFFNLFYGKYSEQLPEILKIYYTIFPEEMEGIKDTVKGMLSEGDIYLRDKQITRQIANEGAMTQENTEYLAETIVRNHMAFLYEIIIHKRGKNLEEDAEEFLEFFDRTVKLIVRSEK